LSCDKKYDDLVTGPPALDVSPNQVADFIGILKKRRSEGEVIITTPDGYDYQNMHDHFLNPDWVYRDSCRYPWRNLRVLPDGSVIPCIGFVVGNVVSDDVSKIWNNAKFRHFRSVLYKEKLFPGCFRCCKLK
jgi:MoaA/NifB/PqqE/SkfB family radical SAM enzyme